MRARPMYISHLSLVNFRNYESLALDLEPGMALFHGANGQGKSNLLEAIYMLAIARSARTSQERQLVRTHPIGEAVDAQVSAVVQRGAERLRLQVGLRVTPTGGGSEAPGRPAAGSPDGPGNGAGPWDAASTAVQKYIRVNGAPARAAGLVGQLNAVMFSAQDLELVYGPPPVRRRYLDILLSQLDSRYLRSLQRYQQVVYQRNHLLRTLREGRANASELEFWDDELVTEGAYILLRRLTALEGLRELADSIHRELTAQGEGLQLRYAPAIETATPASEEGLSHQLRRSLEGQRQREISQGVTLSGPHRDDIRLLIGGLDAGSYASRGQARTLALALRLAEARYLAAQRRQEPVLLLDDVLSELDTARRRRVLESVSAYEQCFVTSADLASIEPRFLAIMASFEVRGGRLLPERTADTSGGITKRT